MIKSDKVYLDHIVYCINKIENFTLNMTKEDFLSNIVIQDATMRNFEVIGEATKKLSKGFREANKEVPWIEIAGMRDKLIHDYIDVDLEIIWMTIQQDIPELKKSLLNLLK